MLESPRTGWFCRACNVPVIGELCERCKRPSASPKIPLRLSPVFKEELQMLSAATGEPVDRFDSLELWTANRHYYYEGTKIFRVIGGSFVDDIKIEWLKNPKLVLSRKSKKERLSENDFRSRMREANRFALGTLEHRAIKFIRGVADTFAHQISYKAVSFSGGKDSAVVSHLVRKAFSDNGILHIFSDTTIENDDTLNFITDFLDKEKVFLVKAEPQQDYKSLVEKAMLPSRLHRWCCTAIKTAPIERIIRQIVEPGKKILMFEGTRSEESLERRPYQPLDCFSKIAIQIAARPILKWTSLEEWLYLLSEGIPLNKSYRFGMRRVGCSLCPLSSNWSEYVLRFRYPSLAQGYVRMLQESIRQLNVDVRIDVNDYISQGKWKVRAGGFGQGHSALAEIPEWDEDYKSINIGLHDDIDRERLTEYLKPLFKSHQLDYFECRVGTKLVMLLTSDLKMRSKITIDKDRLSLSWFDDNEAEFKKFLSRLKKQLVKYTFCAYCGGCETKCAFQAITVDAVNQTYQVKAERCTGCAQCIDVKGGCLLAKSVKSTSTYKLIAKEV